MIVHIIVFKKHTVFHPPNHCFSRFSPSKRAHEGGRGAQMDKNFWTLKKSLYSTDGAVGWALDSHSRGQSSIPGCGSWCRGLEQATHAQLLRFTQQMDYEWVAGLVSTEGTARAVKPWSSFQCTSIHHAVRAQTYKGDEHLAYALNKSTVPWPFFYLFYTSPVRQPQNSGHTISQQENNTCSNIARKFETSIFRLPL